MLECIDAIEKYCGDTDLEADDRTRDAVLRQLQMMTESSKRISEASKAANPQVPWRDLAGFRNVVVHDYLGIRVERITPIVKADLPLLKQQILAILSRVHD